MGQHFVQAQTVDGLKKDEIVDIENGKQKILKLEFNQDNPSESEEKTTSALNEEGETFILVADLSVTLSGGVNALSNQEDREYKSYSDLNYAFQKGDEVLIDGDILNKKGKFFIQLLKYPEMIPIYTRKGLEELKNHRINISEKSIYIIRIGTSAFFDRQIGLTIKRKASSMETKEFNTTVVTMTRFTTIKILEPSHHYINSTSNETFKGGKSEIIIPITPPTDVLEWYYIVSASRDEEEINSNLKHVSLVKDLTKVLNGINPTTAVLNIGIDLLTSPPGSDYCSVYLLDYNNQSLFQNDYQFIYVIEGSRENVKSAKIKVECCKGNQYYLGIKNPDSTYGIHIAIEAVGVRKEEYLEYAK